MANKKVENNNLFASDLFVKTSKDANDLIIVLDDVSNMFKEILKESNKVASSNPLDQTLQTVVKVTKAIGDREKAVEGLTKVERQRATLSEKLEALRKGELDDVVRLKEAIKLESKAIRESQKEILGANNVYEKQRKKLKELTSEYKRLSVVFGENSEEAKEVLAQIKPLDEQLKNIDSSLKNVNKEQKKSLTLYQQQSKNLNDARNEYKNLFLATEQNRKGFKGLFFGLTETGKELRNLRKGIVKGDKALKDLDDRLGQNQRSVGDYTKATKGLSRAFKVLATSTGVLIVLDKLSSALNATADGSGALEKGISRITIPISLFVARLIDAVNASDSFLGVISNLQNGFKGFQKDLRESLRLNDLAIEQNIELIRLEIAKDKAVASAALSQRRQALFADDSTKTLERQIRATEALNKINNDIFEQELAIANKRLSIANTRLAADQKNLEKQKQQSEAFILVKQLEADKEIARLELLRREREIDRDNDELDLDQLIDISDRRKTVFENISRDEVKTFQDRRDALLKANTDIEKSFREQVKVLERTLSESINIDDLINTEDTKELNKKIKALGLDEIRQNRLREVIQERIQANRDLEESERDLVEAEKASNLVQQDSILIEEALNEAQKEGADLQQILLTLSEKRLQAEIDNLRLRLETAEKGSAEEIRLQKELNEKLLDQTQNRIEKEKDLEEKAAEARKKRNEEISEVVFSSVQEFNNKIQYDTLNRIDRELSALDRREQALQELAARGEENAKENLATEQKNRAELERRREEAIKRQQRIELGLSIVETYSQKVAVGDENALSSTITDTSLLLSFINSLPAFWEGAERVGDRIAPHISGRDGHVVRVDGGERVVPTHLNKMIGNVSNFELATLAQMHGSIKDSTPLPSESSDTRIVNELRENTKAIQGLEIPDFRYDHAANALINSRKTRNKIENRIRKNSVL